MVPLTWVGGKNKWVPNQISPNSDSVHPKLQIWHGPNVRGQCSWWWTTWYTFQYLFVLLYFVVNIGHGQYRPRALVPVSSKWKIVQYRLISFRNGPKRLVRLLYWKSHKIQLELSPKFKMASKMAAINGTTPDFGGRRQILNEKFWIFGLFIL